MIEQINSLVGKYIVCFAQTERKTGTIIQSGTVMQKVCEKTNVVPLTGDVANFVYFPKFTRKIDKPCEVFDKWGVLVVATKVEKVYVEDEAREYLKGILEQTKDYSVMTL